MSAELPTPIPDAILSGMPDLRQTVLKELNRRNWTTYQLVVALKGKRPGGKDVPIATVYDFLRGPSPINSADLGLIFQVLGLSVKPGRSSTNKRKAKRSTKRTKDTKN